MEKITKLYSVLKRDGFYTKSLDEFLKQFQDPAYQDKVFNVVTRERLFTKSKEETYRKSVFYFLIIISVIGIIKVINNF